MSEPTSPSEPLVLPDPPERPDCCGGGCAVCVLEGYAADLMRWQQQVEELRRQRAAQTTPSG